MSYTSIYLFKAHTTHHVHGGWCYAERSHITDDYGNAVRIDVSKACHYMQQGRGE